MRKLLALLLLAGCAAQPTPEKIALDKYIEQNRPLAENGAIKWTSYYEGLYSRGVAAGAPAEVIRGYIDLIDAAQALEAGHITELEFQQRRRRFTANVTALAQAEADARRQRERMALRQVIESNARIAAQNQAIIEPTIRTPALQSQSVSRTYTAQANWTGASKMVTTVTNQSGWECKYHFAGQYFTRVFIGSCPSSVPVQ